MIVLIDNYDSFSYNLYQLLGALDGAVRVVRNDAATVEGIKAMGPSHIVLSPGPGRPSDAGITKAAVLAFAGRVPVLGVCLGHQAICEAFGMTVSYAKALMHGKADTMALDTSSPLFAGLPERVQGARYHSLSAVPETLPGELAVIARSQDGEIMGVAHRAHAVYGLQFHPESILTPDGGTMLKNFLGISEQGISGQRRD